MPIVKKMATTRNICIGCREFYRRFNIYQERYLNINFINSTTIKMIPKGESDILRIELSVVGIVIYQLSINASIPTT